jgi:hypothetical protein
MNARGHRVNELDVLLDMRRDRVCHRTHLLTSGRYMAVGRERRVKEAAGLGDSGREAEPIAVPDLDMSADALGREPLRDSLNALGRGSHV